MPEQLRRVHITSLQEGLQHLVTYGDQLQLCSLLVQLDQLALHFTQTNLAVVRGGQKVRLAHAVGQTHAHRPRGHKAQHGPML